jgi:hypothetical protein
MPDKIMVKLPPHGILKHDICHVFGFFKANFETFLKVV